MLTEKTSILIEGDIGGKYRFFAEHKHLGLKFVLQRVIQRSRCFLRVKWMVALDLKGQNQQKKMCKSKLTEKIASLSREIQEDNIHFSLDASIQLLKFDFKCDLLRSRSMFRVKLMVALDLGDEIYFKKCIKLTYQKKQTFQINETIFKYYIFAVLLAYTENRTFSIIFPLIMLLDHQTFFFKCLN